MNAKIVDKKENPLFKREEINIELEHFKEKTPDKKVVTMAAAKLLKTDDKLMIIRKVTTVFGQSRSIIKVHVYKDRKSLEANEPGYLVKRNTFEEAKKEGEAVNG